MSAAKTGHARSRDLPGHQLQCLGLARAGRSCHESMPVQHAQRDADDSTRNGRVVLQQDAELYGWLVEGVAADDPLHLLRDLLDNGLGHVPQIVTTHTVELAEET